MNRSMLNITNRTIEKIKNSIDNYLFQINEALKLDCDSFKFFLAFINMLKQFNNLFSQDIFCPTCGINEFNYKEYLSLSNVICVGGSWEDKTNKKYDFNCRKWINKD